MMTEVCMYEILKGAGEDSMGVSVDSIEQKGKVEKTVTQRGGTGQGLRHMPLMPIWVKSLETMSLTWRESPGVISEHRDRRNPLVPPVEPHFQTKTKKQKTVTQKIEGGSKEQWCW